MKRKLVVMRHGSAEPHSWDGDDFLRKLTPIGVQEVIAIANQFLEYFDWTPEKILCSDAHRTRQTFQFLNNKMKFSTNAQLCSSFYLGSVGQILDEIEKIEDDILNLLIIGHNPSFSELASQLSGEYLSLSPANVALLEKDCPSWVQAVHEEGWNLGKFITPQLT